MAEPFLGMDTVRNPLSPVKAKLRARTLLDAVRTAERNGWIRAAGEPAGPDRRSGPRGRPGVRWGVDDLR
ncbi:hypothetical protein [Streptomyces cremeus]|uniref:hypothetical protein n=1 Tax=Streptomyces cremeus TaxID=66881 RepID=UPI0031ED8768